MSRSRRLEFAGNRIRGVRFICLPCQKAGDFRELAMFAQHTDPALQAEEIARAPQDQGVFEEGHRRDGATVTTRWYGQDEEIRLRCPTCGNRPRPITREQIITAVTSLEPDERGRRVIDYPV